MHFVDLAATITAPLPKDKPYVPPKELVECCKARLPDGATYRIPKITEAEVYLALTKLNTKSCWNRQYKCKIFENCSQYKLTNHRYYKHKSSFYYVSGKYLKIAANIS